METCTDDGIILCAIASLLQPKDLTNLALVCKHFGGTNATLNTEWSMMEEASWCRISVAKDDGNNPWRDLDLLTIRGGEEPWMAVHHRLHLMQTLLVFSHIIGNAITHVNGDITHIQVQGRTSSGTDGLSVAACQKVLQSGRHYAEFIVTKLSSSGIIVGIMS